MERRKIPLYIADILEQADKMLALSFVPKPASGLNLKILEADEHGVKVFAPVIPANVPIYRNNAMYGEHNILFLPDVISDLMLDANKRNVPFDIDHSGTPIKGVEWIESFQIDYKQGKLYKSYHGLTDGTWCAILNIVNPMLQAKICNLDFLGISISGVFSYHEIKLNEAIEIYRELNI